MNAQRSVITLVDFGRALRDERERQNLKLGTQAKALNIGIAEYKRIEAGDLAPDSPTWKRLTAWCPKLKMYESAVKSGKKGGPEIIMKRPLQLVKEPSKAPESAPVSRVEEKKPVIIDDKDVMPATFPEALRWNREQEKLSEADCADLAEVSTSAWKKWETPGHAPPGEENYNKVVAIFPKLNALPRPALRKTPSRNRASAAREAAREVEPIVKVEEKAAQVIERALAPLVAPSTRPAVEWARAFSAFRGARPETQAYIRSLLAAAKAVGLSLEELLAELGDE